METFWHERRAGEFGNGVSVVHGIDELAGPSNELLMGDLRVPDRVRIPAESPVSPGEERRVVAHEHLGCPKHEPETWKEPGRVLHLVLAPVGSLYVAECERCGFVVYALRKGS